MYWFSIGHYEAPAIGNWRYWVSSGHLCLYILHKVEIWKGVTHASLTHSQMKDRATQLVIKFKTGALVTQCPKISIMTERSKISKKSKISWTHPKCPRPPKVTKVSRVSRVPKVCEISILVSARHFFSNRDIASYCAYSQGKISCIINISKAKVDIECSF